MLTGWAQIDRLRRELEEKARGLEVASNEAWWHFSWLSPEAMEREEEGRRHFEASAESRRSQSGAFKGLLRAWGSGSSGRRCDSAV